MRKLASVRHVRSIIPIEGADKIELVEVDGWRCIASKGQYEIGSKVVYFEVDSLLPEVPEFEFLRERCYVNNRNGVGFRIRTMKMRGVFSQGLLIPAPDGVSVGDDLTEHYGVTLYEVQSDANARVPSKGSWPYFLRKTDQDRVQNVIGDLGDETFEVTRKEDGSSITIYRNGYNVGVCSRNLEVKLDGNKYHVGATPILEMLRAIPENIAIQGELMGPGIQGNKRKLKDYQVFIFNIWSIDHQRYLPPGEAMEFIMCLNRLDPNIQPVVYLGVWRTQEGDSIDRYAEMFAVDDPTFEGVVFKSYTSDRSFKYINPHYLVRNKL